MVNSPDHLLTLAAESEGQLREKASRFIAYAFPIADADVFKVMHARIAREHHTCRHVCYAWVLGEDGDVYRANDAGEPTGTAGQPILRRIRAAGLTHAAVVVVRYFGGTLLGKAGLVRAYGEAARIAIANNTITRRMILHPIMLRCSYTIIDPLRNEAMALGGDITTAVYSEDCELTIAMPRSEAERFVAKWCTLGARLVDQPK